METTCTRCHQSLPVDSCYCPSCGLPQLVYTAEPGAIPASSERWPEAVRDAGSIDWKLGIRAILMLALPAGLLSSGISPLSVFGIFWMMGAAIWADVLYMRRQRTALITTGAGARIGLVTGLVAAWLVFGLTGADLVVHRVMQREGSQMDAEWHTAIDKFYQQFEAQVTAPADVLQQLEAQHRWVLTPEARAGAQMFGLLFYCFVLTLFAVAGGAVGARVVGRRRHPEI
jgi:hypothetical protein